MLRTDEWAWSLTATLAVTPGARSRRARPTSRATASAERLAAEPPVTNTPPAVAGSPARSAIQRRAWFSAAIAPDASSQLIPWRDAAETTMSKSSDALLGAAGMNAR